MRHKYQTSGIVLARAPQGEANALLALLTPELGLVRARAQGLRKRGAKLAPALMTLAESEVTLVRGGEGWRLAGAALTRNWARALSAPARLRAGRVLGLFLRLADAEAADERLFATLREFLRTLIENEEAAHDAAECLAALRILSLLGFDEGGLPAEGFSAAALADIEADRPRVIARINRGIEASGL